MKILKYIDTEKHVWDKYIEMLRGCPYTYCTYWHDFQKEYVENKLMADESYMVIQDEMPLIVVKAFVEKRNDGFLYIGWDNGFVEAPFVNVELPYLRQDKLIKEAMIMLEEFALKYGCKKSMLKFDVLSNPRFEHFIYNYNWLSKYEFLDYSSFSQVLDLTKTEEELKHDFRKGTKSEIKKGKCLKIVLKDYSNITTQDILDCKEIYEYDAGRTTRTSELLLYYHCLIKNNMGLLAFAELNGRRIATIICVFYHSRGYYLLYAEKTDQAEKTSPGYWLQYQIIMELKRRGIAFYDIGEQVFGKTHWGLPEPKEKNISLFKRGFGGYTVPMFRGIKIYE